MAAQPPPRRPVPPQSIVLPLVLQEVDATALGLNEQQRQVIAELRQTFMEEIGGENQNPGDPAYLARWQEAQPEVDDPLKGKLGFAAYSDYQMAVLNNAQTPATNAP